MPVVGDRVQWLASQDEGTIEQIEPRRNLFYRQDELRIKSFAANLDQILILIAAEPEFSENQLTRTLIAAEAARITPVIALNKRDLKTPFERAWSRLLPYRSMGYELLALTLKGDGSTNCDELCAKLRGKTTLVIGPSGAGKSTLINWLVPNARVQTQALSLALRSGKHTTTSTTWYWLDALRSAALIDSPGFQEFGLRHLAPEQLAAYMPDLRAQLTGCKFYNCTHLHEPGCAVLAQVQRQDAGTAAGAITPARYKMYSELFAELARSRFA